METLLLRIYESHGIWAVVAFVMFVFLIRFVNKWNVDNARREKESAEREKKHLETIKELTDSVGLVDNVNRRTQHIDDGVMCIDKNVTAIYNKVVARAVNE